MGGHQVPSQGPGDDGWDEEGYDESQRAEILEATRNGPTDGVLLTDIEPDLGDDTVEDEPIGELDMDSEEVGTSDASVDMDADDVDEDDLQEDFEDDTVADGDIDEADDTALRP
ncbi:DNA primase [Sphingomonas sp. Leaf21]|jgi:hypothetical protein|uniref:DNA primase n=1 Tax=Sphingomonas sp. Leaf21 TaxID=2876550 RepID=UPI001E639524|nr:DNA primase [Sphingomonas sp. Leaf21]